MLRLLLILSFIFFLSQNTAFAQDEDAPKGYLAIAFGPTKTSGNFSESNWDNDKSGFAKNGYNYTILDFGYKFIPNFGLSGAIKGAVLPLDVQALADGYAEEYGGQFTVKSTRWGFTGFFVGPFASIPTKYVDIDFKLMTGLLIAVSPDMTVSRTGQVATQNSAAGSSIAFNSGVAARIHLSKKLGLLAQADYHLSRPTFLITYTDTNNDQKTVNTGQTMTMFNFSFGIVYRIFSPD